MKWSDIGDLVGTAAPLVGTLLGGPAGGAVGSLVAVALGSDPTPEAVKAAIEADPAASEKLLLLQEENRARLQEMVLQEGTKRISEVNQTFRSEVKSDDKFVRRWRPFFGYVVGLTWFLQTMAIVIAVISSVFDPIDGAVLLDAVAVLAQALMGQWAVALAVLGVNVSSRSQDKVVAAGHPPAPGILGALANRLAGGAK